ncbi:MAG TPA: hypothetical protein VMB26_17515 [Candidatus Binataceae bacterium]|nr:hypothetical protein [Candidatus Binataceae bacterium]
MGRVGKIVLALALVALWASTGLSTTAVVGTTNETFIQFVTAQAGTSTTTTTTGPLMVQSCNTGGTSFDPVSSDVAVDVNNVPIQTVYFEWTGGTGYENLVGDCSVTSGSTTQSFSFYIPIIFTQSSNSNKIPVTAQTVTDTSSIPSQCGFSTNLGVINSQTPSASTSEENLQVYALANPSDELTADQIPAVGVDIQAFYNGAVVNKWSHGGGGTTAAGTPFLIRVMCSTLAHFQTNS